MQERDADHDDRPYGSRVGSGNHTKLPSHRRSAGNIVANKYEMKTDSILAIMKSLPFNYLLIASMAMMMMMMMMMTTSISAFQSSALSSNHPLHRSSILRPTPTFAKQHRSDVRILLEMAAAGDGNEDGSSSGSKQRRRKRKKSSDSSGDVVAATTPTDDSDDVDDDETTTTKQPSAKALVQEILAREQMMNYDEYEDLTSFTPVRLEEDDRIAAAAQRAGYSISGSSSEDVTNRGVVGGGSGGTQLEDLFDSREFLQRKREKQIEENAASTLASTGVPTKKKIKRSDIKAYNKLLEMDPIADEDDSYFEDEGIDFISALLGDVEPGVGNDSDESSNKTGKKVQKKTSFLGIGSGPLQVGHFIGALGVILMAFVEYPGFPLTNLPDPLRASLQEGLGTIYLVNSILAVFAFMSAPSRNQSAILWGAKTFAVGGIAYDQLMQIPTPEESAENARKEMERLNKMSGRRGRRQK